MRSLDQRTIGDYEVKLWAPDGGADMKKANGYGIFTIERSGSLLMTVDQADYIQDPPINDLTGDGNPEILLRRRNGGSHCCTGTFLIDFGHEPVELLNIWSSVQGDWGSGDFVDLDGDGVYEFITADAIQAPCTTPTVKVILQYQPGAGYQPASPRFPEQYDEAIDFYQERLVPEFESSGGVHHCSIPELAAAYYFSGRPEEARSVFQLYYTAEDAEAYWLELVAGFRQARFYTD